MSILVPRNSWSKWQGTTDGWDKKEGCSGLEETRCSLSNYKQQLQLSATLAVVLLYFAVGFTMDRRREWKEYRIVLFWQGWILRSLLWLKTFQGRSVLRNGISQILPFSHFWEPMTVWRESTKQGMTIEQGTGLTEKWDFRFIFMF